MSTSIRRALYGKLAADTTLNNLLGTPRQGYSKAIYHDQAPSEASFPYVIFSKSSGVPTDTLGKAGAFESDVWLIKAVDRNTTADRAEAAAARIQALLNDASLSISGATELYLRRQSDVEYPEIADGERYEHVGSLYLLIYT